ncbi:MAG: hypothetical protein FJ291_23095 [Planctomycetes bacterium]|nr:hypothetical protein [Planctomycetota bacterium]
MTHTCPGCGGSYEVADNLVGRRVRCSQCGTVSVAGATSGARPTPRVPVPPPAPPPPVGPVVPAPALPQGRTRGVPLRTPRRIWISVAIGVGVAATCALVGLLAFFTGGWGSAYPTPKAAFEGMLRAARSDDKRAFLTCLDKYTRACLADPQKQVSEEQWSAIMGRVKQTFRDPIFGEPRIDGEMATMEVRNRGEETTLERFRFVKEGSGWKVSIPELVAARQQYQLLENRNNLNQLSRGVAEYLNSVGGNRFYPAGLGELFDKRIVPDRAVFVSPLDENPPKLPNGLKCSYVSCFDKYPDRVFRDDLPPDAMIAWDRIAFVRRLRTVLFCDSRVELVEEERFQQLLEQLDALAMRCPKRKGGGDK